MAVRLMGMVVGAGLGLAAVGMWACGAGPEHESSAVGPLRAAVDGAAPWEKNTSVSDLCVDPFASTPGADRLACGPFADDYLAFDRACEPGTQIVVAAVGDVLLHGPLQRQGATHPKRFVSLWQPVVELLRRPDVTYANLEGPTAAGINRRGKLVPDPGLVFDNRVYSSFSRFNYHASLVTDLVHSGVDIVSTANNHALDRDSLGVDRTLDVLDAAGLAHTGTNRKGSSEPWHTITEVQGIRIAWLACTLHTNWSQDIYHQVLHCFDDPSLVPALVRDLAYNPRHQIDAVIVTPHWGAEYQPLPQSEVVVFAHQVLEAGATAVLGSHPHVLQPWERYRTADGRETFVVYSLGNFVSVQRSLPRRASIILHLGLTKNATGEVFINGARYIPIHVRHGSQGFVVEPLTATGDFKRAYTHVMATLGTSNAVSPDESWVTNVHCPPVSLPAK